MQLSLATRGCLALAAVAGRFQPQSFAIFRYERNRNSERKLRLYAEVNAGAGRGIRVNSLNINIYL